MKKIGNDILDPTIKAPIAMADGITIRFPPSWALQEDRDRWREQYLRSAYLRARGKD